MYQLYLFYLDLVSSFRMICNQWENKESSGPKTSEKKLESDRRKGIEKPDKNMITLIIYIMHFQNHEENVLANLNYVITRAITVNSRIHPCNQGYFAIKIQKVVKLWDQRRKCPSKK